MKRTLLALLVLVYVPTLVAQQKMIVFLDAKSDQAVSYTQFSARSLERRLDRTVGFDEKDKPVQAEYLSSLKEDGTILNTSRWLNAVSYETFLSPEELMAKHAFITRISAVGNAKPSGRDKFENFSKTLNYGEGFPQSDQIGLVCLHDMGYTGSGIYLGIIDAGFDGMDTISYFGSVYNESRVLDQYNFVAGNTSVYNSSSHGTSVASCIVGEKNAPNEFAGTAIDVDLALYLAEDVASETEIEEFNVVAALERCDSVGVDVVNISLGYFNFDDTLTSHVYADMDGKTTIAAMGVNVAASKGIAVVIAAGNDGPGTIATPCDADSCLCIGAVDFFSNYAFFSSVGPSADGQVKPDVAARGLDTWVVTNAGDLTTGSGTSFATPVMAGATACLVQAYPNRSVDEIFTAIRMSASQFANPDNLLGYGIADMCAAYDLLIDYTGVEELSANGLSVAPNPANESLVVKIPGATEQTRIVLYNELGEIVLEGRPALSVGAAWLDVHALRSGSYVVKVYGEQGVEHAKVIIQH